LNLSRFYASSSIIKINKLLNFKIVTRWLWIQI